MELFSFPWLHPLCIGRQKVSKREGENEFIPVEGKKNQVLSLSKLACVMGFCLEGVEPADKQRAGRYICLLLLHNPAQHYPKSICIISVGSVANIYCANFLHRAPFRLSSCALTLTKLARVRLLTVK